MKPKLALIAFLFLTPYYLSAQSGEVLNNVVFKSQILQSEQHFSVYLPAGYANSGNSYPVLYLLHGAGGDYSSWQKEANMQGITDSCMKTGLKPFIIVMPDAAMTYYMNNRNGSYQYEDFFVKELIPYIESHYRCKTEKRYRAIAGLSMGGFGCLLYAMHHPGLFSTCYAMSASVRTDDDIIRMPLKDFQQRYTTALGTIHANDNRITPFWHQNSILYLAENMPDSQKNQVRFFIDCGDDDLLSKGNALLHILMQEKHIQHEYRVKNGAHTWPYWQNALPGALQFVAEGF